MDRKRQDMNFDLMETGLWEMVNTVRQSRDKLNRQARLEFSYCSLFGAQFSFEDIAAMLVVAIDELSGRETAR